MGHMRHHAILVTTIYESKAKKARKKAKRLGALVTPIQLTKLNGIRTFVVLPDGSKEGWPESDAGDETRDQFIKWLESKAHDDGSSPYDWAEVRYGDDEGANGLVRCSR